MKYYIKKYIALVSVFCFGFNMLSIQAYSYEDKMDDINIISSSKITKQNAQNWARSKNATNTFLELADIYWDVFSEHGNINPGIAYVQAAIETGFGNFGGVLDESYNNPCGMKNPSGGEDLDPNAHYRFNSWNEGVRAHLDHLALYAGADGYPRKDTYDPRHFSFLIGTAKTVKNLSGKWATDKEYGNKIIKNYNEIVELNYKEAKINIDIPIDNYNYDKEIKIRGWAVNNSGVKEVKAYIDGKYVSNIKNGINRPDVGVVYPDYPNSLNSGFEDIIDISSYSEGKYILKIEAIGNDNSVKSQEKIIYKEIKRPKMTIDIPNLGDEVNQKLKIRGWALNNSGIKEVKAYINEEYIKNIKNGINRPDVDQAYPGYIDGENSGFEDFIDMTKYRVDKYKLKLECIGNDGDIQSQEVEFVKGKKEPKINLDLPIIDGRFDKQILIKGWALDDSGIKNIKLYIDGKYVKEIKNGINRPDVENKYPGYTNASIAGFEECIDISNYKTDEYILKIEAEANDGSIQIQEKRFYVGKKESIIQMDLPLTNSAFNQNLIIRGWSLDDSGIKEINAYINNKYIKTLNKDIERDDVAEVYPGYTNSFNSGFEDSIDISAYENGKYTLKIESISNDNLKKIQEIDFFVGKKASIMNVDLPIQNSRFENEVFVKGWALDSSGIKEVKAYVDGKYIKNLNKGIFRDDVNIAYPEYVDSLNSGFEGAIRLNLNPDEAHNLSIEVIAFDGHIQMQEINIKPRKKQSKISVDLPKQGDKFNREIKIRGWALADSGIREVKAYINGAYLKNIKNGFKREDVQSVYPNYIDSLNSGFEDTLNVENYKNNEYILKIEVISNEGDIFSQDINIVNNKASTPNIIDLGLNFNFGAEGPLPNNPEMLVMHHAAGNSTVQSVHDFHKYSNGWAGIGYHFYIHKDGTIYKGREESWRGAHTGNDNNARSLGISVQGNYENSSSIPVDKTMPKAQEDAVVKLGQYLVEKYGISQVFGHRDVGSSTCPGRYYPFERIKARILSKSIYVIDSDNLENIPN